MSNEELVYDIQSNIGDRNEKLLLLFDQNSGLIHKLITPYLGVLEESDLLQYAFLALYPAVDGYDLNGSQFMTYYSMHLKNTIREALRNNACSGCSGISYNLYFLIRKYDNFISDYQCAHGRKPTARVICSSLNINTKQEREIRKVKKLLTESRSIDELLPGNEELTFADTIPSGEDMEADIIREIEQSELEVDMKHALAALPDDIRRIIMLYYVQGLPPEQIMKATGTAYNEYQYKRTRGISLLKKDASIKRRLKEYYAEHSFYHTGLNRFINHGSEVERNAIDMLYYEKRLLSAGR